MTDQVATSIDIPAAISPADAEVYRSQILSKLEIAKDSSGSVTLDVDQPSLSPVALQLLIATTRTAETFGVALDISDECQGVFADLRLK